jgi:hypothetical protein
MEPWNGRWWALGASWCSCPGCGTPHACNFYPAPPATPVPSAGVQQKASKPLKAGRSWLCLTPSQKREKIRMMVNG